MTASVLAVLVATAVLVAASTAVLIAAATLLYAYRRLEPQERIMVRVSTLQAMVENLEGQVIQLRTKKAGKASAAKKQAVEETASDQDLDGLNEDERALFM